MARIPMPAALPRFSRDNDLLMLITKILIFVIRIGIIVGIVVAAIGVLTNGIVLFYALGGKAVPLTGPRWPTGPVAVAPALAMTAIPILTIALLGLLNTFLGKLSALMDTVAVGDPFTPDNAKRLQRMGLFALAVQILGSLIRLLVAVAGPEHLSNVYLSSSLKLSPAGIVLALTLLILARMFARGTSMREDLAGTV